MTYGPQESSRYVVSAVVVAIAATVLLAGCTEKLPYQGETIRMHVRRWNFYAYPEVHPDDIPKVERLMRSAVFPRTFRDEDELTRAVLALKVPNYGWSGGEFVSPAGVLLILNCVEIPDRGIERCVLYARDPNGTYRLEDDFVGAGISGATDARVERDRIFYHTCPKQL